MLTYEGTPPLARPAPGKSRPEASVQRLYAISHSLGFCPPPGKTKGLSGVCNPLTLYHPSDPSLAPRIPPCRCPRGKLSGMQRDVRRACTAPSSARSAAAATRRDRDPRDPRARTEAPKAPPPPGWGPPLYRLGAFVGSRASSAVRRGGQEGSTR